MLMSVQAKKSNNRLYNTAKRTANKRSPTKVVATQFQDEEKEEYTPAARNCTTDFSSPKLSGRQIESTPFHHQRPKTRSSSPFLKTVEEPIAADFDSDASTSRLLMDLANQDNKATKRPQPAPAYVLRLDSPGTHYTELNLAKDHLTHLLRGALEKIPQMNPAAFETIRAAWHKAIQALETSADSSEITLL